MDMVLVAIGVGFAVLLFVMFGTKLGKDPTKKTVEQLEREQRLHARYIRTLTLGTEESLKAHEQAKRVDDELEWRYLICNEGQAPYVFRARAFSNFDEGWRRGQSEGKDENKCLEMALVNVLYCFAKDNNLSKIIDENNLEDFFGYLMLEVMPFKKLGKTRSRKAIADYVLWQCNPKWINSDILSHDIEAGLNIIAEKNVESTFNYRKIPYAWTQLISQSKN
ncbi:hypothetical protein [Rhodospirillum rubrum]|nr:hypothetical protein [Rhodospirillum rubrum]QXG80967.1 hypothetical protein KUL73_02510 [Rhodospirillum rubrum]